MMDDVRSRLGLARTRCDGMYARARSSAVRERWRYVWEINFMCAFERAEGRWMRA
jgi:hypothetical protein